MRVTEVKVFPVTDEKLKAFVSVVLDNCFMVNDIKVIEGRDGRFISMPSRRKRNGKFKDIAHPLNSDTRQMLESEILGEYERLLNGDGAPAPKNRKSRSRRQRKARETAGETAPSAAEGERPAGTSADPAPETSDAPSARSVPEPPKQDAAQPEPTGEKTLEEVTEKHLSDSFWTS